MKHHLIAFPTYIPHFFHFDLSFLSCTSKHACSSSHYDMLSMKAGNVNSSQLLFSQFRDYLRRQRVREAFMLESASAPRDDDDHFGRTRRNFAER